MDPAVAAIVDDNPATTVMRCLVDPNSNAEYFYDTVLGVPDETGNSANSCCFSAGKLVPSHEGTNLRLADDGVSESV